MSVWAKTAARSKFFNILEIIQKYASALSAIKTVNKRRNIWSPLVDITPVYSHTLLLVSSYIGSTKTKWYGREKASKAFHPISHHFLVLKDDGVRKVESKVEYSTTACCQVSLSEEYAEQEGCKEGYSTSFIQHYRGNCGYSALYLVKI